MPIMGSVEARSNSTNREPCLAIGQGSPLVCDLLLFPENISTNKGFFFLLCSRFFFVLSRYDNNLHPINVFLLWAGRSWGVNDWSVDIIQQNKLLKRTLPSLQPSNVG